MLSLETLVSVQVTRFDCGGIAIGGVLLHKLLDGVGMSHFFNTGAKIARGDTRVENMSLDFTSSSLLFPAENHFPEEVVEAKKKLFFDEGNSLVRRFLFDAKAIEAIKLKVDSENIVPNPTRVEALTTFIWKHMMLATRAVKGSSLRPFMVTHSVNLRPRLDPKLTNVFGNLILFATSECSKMSEILELSHLAGIVRQMIENVNSENLKLLEGDGAARTYIVEMASNIGNVFPDTDTYKFSEMFELENDEDFLAYASPNPSIYAP